LSSTVHTAARSAPATGAGAAKTVPGLQELRAICHKGEAEYGSIPYISRKFIHPQVSIRLTRLFLLAGVGGDAVTVLMVMVDVAGTLLFLSQDALLRALGCLCVLGSWVLDHVDGEILRFHRQSSSYGILLDRFGHTVGHPLLHLCLGYSLAQQNQAFLMLGACNAAALLMIFAAELEVKILTLLGRKVSPVRTQRRSGGKVWNAGRRFFGLFQGMIMIGYGPYVATFLLAAIWAGWTSEFYLMLSVAIYANLGLVLYQTLRDAHQARRERWMAQS